MSTANQLRVWGAESPSSGHDDGLPVVIWLPMRNLLLYLDRIPSLRASCGLSSELSIFGAARPANGPRLLHTIPFLLLIWAGFLLPFPDLCSLQVVFCYSSFRLTVIRAPISPGNGKVAAEQTIPLPLCYRTSYCKCSEALSAGRRVPAGIDRVKFLPYRRHPSTSDKMNKQRSYSIFGSASYALYHTSPPTICCQCLDGVRTPYLRLVRSAHSMT